VRLRTAIAGVALLGIGVAAYLTAVHYAHTSPICSTGGCETVQHSSYAELGGVPVALLGLLAYILILLTAGFGGVPAARRGAETAGAGSAFSGYLLWAQLARIHAFCQWCVGNDAIVAVLAVLCAARLLREPEG
jgi:uncharacterized membrane protein